MARKTVRYYFSFGSPFAALADTRIDALVEQVGADLEPIPIVAPPADPPEGVAATLQELKSSYQYEDAARSARKLGLPWHSSALSQRPVEAMDASIGYYVAREESAERAYRHRVFRAFWAEGRDIDDRNVLGDCARDAGLSRDGFMKRLDDEQYRNTFITQAMLGIEDRVFGVPFFILDGERFWGSDRLDVLLDALSGQT